MATAMIGNLEVEDWRERVRSRTKHKPGFQGSSLVIWDGSYWRYRERNKRIDTITIHHSEGSGDQTIKELADWCVTHETPYLHWFPECAYHFIVQQDGHIGYCIDVSKRSWHCGHENDNAVGVCLVGRYDYGIMPPAAQLESARQLLAALRAAYPGVGFRGHREMRDPESPTGTCQKTCPGETWPRWRSQIMPGEVPPFDWPALWGDRVPYNPQFGIPRAWREEYMAGRKPGAATGSEFLCTAQEFERTIILWVNGQARVYYHTLPEDEPLDWQALWGDRAPYHSQFGIPRAWREEYRRVRTPGPAMGPEFGCTAQEFEQALILWVSGQARVYYCH